VLLLLLALWFNRKKREKNLTLADDTDSTADISADKDHEKKIHITGIQKLAALRKAVQNSASKDESTAVIRMDKQKQQENTSIPDKAEESALVEARLLDRKGKPDHAIKQLELLLNKNDDSEQGWALLFEILHRQKLKSAFRKHARRFKRIEKFPEVWKKIQTWGHALEPDEPLYMSTQERKKRFFSN